MDRFVIRWPVIIVAAVLLAVGFGAVVVSGEKQLDALEKQAVESHQELILAQETITMLNLELKQVGSNSYIENAARKYYSYLKPGELRFEISNPDCLKGYTEQEMQLRVAELLR